MWREEKKGQNATRTTLLRYIEYATRMVAKSSLDLPKVVADIAAQKLQSFYTRRGRVVGLAERYHDIGDWRVLRNRLQKVAARDRRQSHRLFARDALAALDAPEPPMPEKAAAFARDWQRRERRRYVEKPEPVTVHLRMGGPGKLNRQSLAIATFRTVEEARNFAGHQPAERLARWARVCWPRHHRYMDASLASDPAPENLFWLALHHPWFLPTQGEVVRFSGKRDHREVIVTLTPKPLIKRAYSKRRSWQQGEPPLHGRQMRLEHQAARTASKTNSGDALRNYLKDAASGAVLYEIQQRTLANKRHRERARERRAVRRLFLTK